MISEAKITTSEAVQIEWEALADGGFKLTVGDVEIDLTREETIQNVNVINMLLQNPVKTKIGCDAFKPNRFWEKSSDKSLGFYQQNLKSFYDE